MMTTTISPDCDSRPEEDASSSVDAGPPKLSVTVLNYNYAHYLPECLESILSQTFNDFELIIIDDCSTDNSLEIIKRYLHDPRVRMVAHEVNQGYVKSLIEGAELHSRGDYLTVISADDAVRQVDAFAQQMTTLEVEEHVVMCFSGFERFDNGSGETLNIVKDFDHDVVLDGLDVLRLYTIERRIQILHSGTIVRKSAYTKCGGYPREFRYATDFALWAALSLEGDVAYCAQALYRYRIHRAQMSLSVAGVRATMHEVMNVIDAACAAAMQRGLDTTLMRHAAIKREVYVEALGDALEGRRRLALIRAFSGLTIFPGNALTSQGWWRVLVRSVLGESGVRVVRTILRVAPTRANLHSGWFPGKERVSQAIQAPTGQDSSRTVDSSQTLNPTDDRF